MPRLKHFALPSLLCALLGALSIGVTAQDGPVSRPDAPVNGANESRKVTLPELPEVAEHILRFPTISPDGKNIAYVYDGDIWVSDSEGKNAERRTITEGNDSSPLYSPDGQWLAFRSMRYGNYDIFIMPAEGGKARRLTYHDAHDYPSAWLPDSGGLIFSSARRNSAYDLHCVRLDGTEAWPISDGGYRQSEFFGSVSPDGKRIAYCTNGGMTSYRRRGYQGTSSNDLWVCDFDGRLTSNHRRVVESGYHECWPHFLDKDHLLYTSFDGKEDHRVSRFRVANLGEGGEVEPGALLEELRDVREVSFSAGGLAFSTGAYGGWRVGMIAMDEDGNPEDEVLWPDFDMSKDARDAGMKLNSHRSASEFAVSPNGKLLAFIAGGDLYVMPTASGGRAKRLTDTLARELQVSFSKDSSTILYSSQREGVSNLYLYDLTKWSERQLTTTRDGAASGIFAHDGKSIYYVSAEKAIKQIDLEGKAKEFLIPQRLHGAERHSSHAISLSPQGRWMLYEGEDELGNTTIKVADLHNDAKTHTLTRRYGDSIHAVFSKDSKHLVFTCSEVDDYDIYVMDLQRPTVEFAEDKLEEAFAKKGERKEDKKEDAKEVEPIDFADLGERTRRLSTHRGHELYPAVIGSNVFFLSSNGGRTQNLWSQPLKGGVAKQLTTSTSRKSRLHATPDYKYLWMIDNNRPTRLSAAGTGPRSFAINVQHRVNATAMREQVMSEASWVMENYFYDPNLHGVPWKEITKHYAKAAKGVSTNDEFSSIMNELFGELNSSHQRYSVSDPRSDGYSESMGHLGLIFDDGQLADGHYLIKEVIKNGPCDHRDSNVKAGLFLVGINGELFSDRQGVPVNLSRLLLDTVGKKTVLHLASSPDSEEWLTTAVKPTTSRVLSELFYQRWVRAQRAMVHELSDGKLGYVHIRRQDGASLAHFMHHLGDDNIGKEGLIFDVRFNGGGSTAVHQLEVLQKKAWLIRRARDADWTVTENIHRSNALEKPSALLINGSSFSNAEILAEGYRQMKIGPIIGVPTGGGVISTSRHTLVDGSTMRLPLMGIWDLSGENLENNGRKPDHHVENTPEILNSGKDAQTAKAVEVLLKKLKK